MLKSLEIAAGGSGCFVTWKLKPGWREVSYLWMCNWIFSCLLHWVILGKSLEFFVSLFVSSCVLSHLHLSCPMKTVILSGEEDPWVGEVAVTYSGTKVWYLRLRAQLPERVLALSRGYCATSLSPIFSSVNNGVHLLVVLCGLDELRRVYST